MQLPLLRASRTQATSFVRIQMCWSKIVAQLCQAQARQLQRPKLWLMRPLKYLLVGLLSLQAKHVHVDWLTSALAQQAAGRRGSCLNMPANPRV